MLSSEGRVELGFGCWAIGGPFWEGNQALGWGEVDDAESKAALWAAYEGGIRFFDTADLYGAGHSEKVLGEALRGVRDEVRIATKFGFTFNASSRRVTGSDVSAGYVQRACEESLRRLGTDRIDVYFLHVPTLGDAERESVFSAMNQLKQAGKILRIGWSTDDLDSARWALSEGVCDTIQYEKNVFRCAETMDTLCRSESVSRVIRSPLAMGLLSEKTLTGRTLSRSDIRNVSPDWLDYYRDGAANPELVERLKAMREALTQGGRTIAQAALGWLWARDGGCVPIPGIRTVAQARQACVAMEQGPLEDEVMEAVERLRRAGC